MRRDHISSDEDRSLDIVSDIHGCRDELEELLAKMGYRQEHGTFHSPDGRVLVVNGDLTDRGPDSIGTIRLVADLVDAGEAYYTPGNHCDKLYRYLRGNPVKLMHGLETTAAELCALPRDEYEKVRRRFVLLVESSPYYFVFRAHDLIVAHAGLPQNLIGHTDKKTQEFVLYGERTGRRDQYGLPVRGDWFNRYKGPYFVVYGHTPHREPVQTGWTLNIDTGCVFGGALTSFRWPERELVSVPAKRTYAESKRPL